MAIRVLPAELVNKIAAGEVVERPASVVKELVENSLDAGAGRIEIDVEQGGVQRIRVVDDGCGIAPDDLPLAFASHATSKLADESDLTAIRTMGFRGEALASIGSVSKARIVSRTADSDSGYEIEMQGGVLGSLKACGAPPGTQVEVRDLFYNVPARRKFLKSTATEMAHLSEAVTRLAISHPAVQFSLVHNGRQVFDLAPAEGLAQRIGEFFGSEIAENLIPFRWHDETLLLEGYLLPPSVSRRTTRMQYTYVNRRFVRNATLSHAIAEAYAGLMPTDRRPVCFLFLTLDPAAVDVNVHPTKLEVRFRNRRAVHERVLEAMRQTLREAALTPRVVLSGRPEPQAPTDAVRQAIADFFARAEQRAAGPAVQAPLKPSRPARSPPGQPAAGATPPALPQPTVRYGECMQVLDTYLVEETPEGILITDQHALHERILYEEVRARLAEGSLPAQRLLVPQLVELPQQEFCAVLQMRDQLVRFGVELEPFGQRTVIVRSHPQVLRKFDAREFLRDVVAELDPSAGAERMEQQVEALCRLLACRGAVKAGQRLSPAQMRGLLERRAELTQQSTCPHGRPTSILITRSELEKHFHRT